MDTISNQYCSDFKELFSCQQLYYLGLATLRATLYYGQGSQSGSLKFTYGHFPGNLKLICMRSQAFKCSIKTYVTGLLTRF